MFYRNVGLGKCVQRITFLQFRRVQVHQVLGQLVDNHVCLVLPGSGGGRECLQNVWYGLTWVEQGRGRVSQQGGAGRPGQRGVVHRLLTGVNTKDAMNKPFSGLLSRLH